MRRFVKDGEDKSNAAGMDGGNLRVEKKSPRLRRVQGGGPLAKPHPILLRSLCFTGFRAEMTGTVRGFI